MASKSCLAIYTILHTISIHQPSPPQYHLPDWVPPRRQQWSLAAKQMLVSLSSLATYAIDIIMSNRRRPPKVRHHETDALRKIVESGYHVRKTTTMCSLAKHQELCLRGSVAGNKQRKYVGLKLQACARTVIWQSHRASEWQCTEKHVRPLPITNLRRASLMMSSRVTRLYSNSCRGDSSTHDMQYELLTFCLPFSISSSCPGELRNQNQSHRATRPDLIPGSASGGYNLRRTPDKLRMFFSSMMGNNSAVDAHT